MVRGVVVVAATKLVLRRMVSVGHGQTDTRFAYTQPPNGTPGDAPQICGHTY